MLQKLKQIAIKHIPVYRDVCARSEYDAVVANIKAEISTFDRDRANIVGKIVNNLLLPGSIKEIIKNWISFNDYSDMVPSKTEDLQIRSAFNIGKQLTATLSKIVGIQVMEGPVTLVYRMYANKDDTEAPNDHYPTKKLKLSMVSTPVQAKTQKLTTGWTLEAAQDLLTMHALDMATEMVSIVAQAVSGEIVHLVLSDLQKIAAFRSEVPESEALEQIFKTSSDIGSSTRRGVANFIVVSRDALDLIAPSIILADRIANDDAGGLHYIGIIDRGTVNVTVFMNDFAPDGTILIGYKGSSEFDTGYVLSPYKMFNVGSIVISPETYQPYVSTYSRFGTTGEHTYGNYYGLITVKRDEH